MSRNPAPLRRLVALAVTAGALAASGGDMAQAQVFVDGRPDAVHVEARDVPLQEILAALETKFNLRYRSNDALEMRKTGIFDGTLPHVAARILSGYDFAMKITSQGIDVLILRQSQAEGGPFAAELSDRPTPVRSPARVMTAAEANRYERGQVR